MNLVRLFCLIHVFYPSPTDKCAAEKLDPVCGSDGNTYMNMCLFKTAKINNPGLKMEGCVWVRSTRAYGKMCQSSQPILLDGKCYKTVGSKMLLSVKRDRLSDRQIDGWTDVLTDRRMDRWTNRVTLDYDFFSF